MHGAHGARPVARRKPAAVAGLHTLEAERHRLEEEAQRTVLAEGTRAGQGPDRRNQEQELEGKDAAVEAGKALGLVLLAEDRLVAQREAVAEEGNLVQAAAEALLVEGSLVAAGEVDRWVGAGCTSEQVLLLPAVECSCEELKLSPTMDDTHGRHANQNRLIFGLRRLILIPPTY